MNDDPSISVRCPPTRFVAIDERDVVPVSLKMKRARDANDSGADNGDPAWYRGAFGEERILLCSHVRIVSAFLRRAHKNVRRTSLAEDSCTLENEPIYVRLPTGGRGRRQDLLDTEHSVGVR